jgi:hypothetical protein
MSTAIRHFFIAAPVEQAASMWEEFQSRSSVEDAAYELLWPKEREGVEVHFIPAQGGCFFVAVPLARRRRNWLGQLIQAGSPAASPAKIERFRALLARRAASQLSPGLGLG